MLLGGMGRPRSAAESSLQRGVATECAHALSARLPLTVQPRCVEVRCPEGVLLIKGNAAAEERQQRGGRACSSCSGSHPCKRHDAWGDAEHLLSLLFWRLLSEQQISSAPAPGRLVAARHNSAQPLAAAQGGGSGRLLRSAGQVLLGRLRPGIGGDTQEVDAYAGSCIMGSGRSVVIGGCLAESRAPFYSGSPACQLLTAWEGWPLPAPGALPN